MTSLCSSALSSLDDSLTLLYESSRKLKAATSVDTAEVIEQLKMAAESARNVRALVSSELPEASWQNREELEALLEEIQKSVEARALEQLRSRLLALATELERGSIVHRRALRVNRLNQLRDQAINELRSQAGWEVVPQTLPGPEADQWIEWACSLKEPADAESLQVLRDEFAHLDEFVANLEPSMWIAAGSPTFEILPEPERSADKTHQERSRLETNGFEEPGVSSGPIPIGLKAAKSSGGRDEPRVPPALDEPSLLALESDTFTPNSVTPPRTEEEAPRMPAQKHALLASTMGLVTDRVRRFNHPVESPVAAELFRETSAAPATASDIRIGVEEPLGGEWRMLVATAAVLVLAVLGALLWRSRRNHNSDGPVQAMERKIESPRTQAQPPPPLLHKQPIEGAQHNILLTMELCERINPRSIECWGYASNLRDESSDVSLYRADVIDGKGTSFNLSSNGQFDFSTGQTFNIPARSSVKYTIKIPDNNQDVQTLTLYLDINNPRDLEYTFRDVPVAD